MTEKWYQLSVETHRRYGGKISVIPKVPVRSIEDFAIYYTPGIAEVSRQIHKNPEMAFELTSRWNIIGVLTDGTRVLGLGNIGPEAAYPVMEGKALIFKYLGGVDAIPIPIRVRTPEEFIFVAKALEPALGGINLEDIESPKCFYLLDKLREELKIPVWHDDQQGTATATLAGLINALKLVGKKFSDVVIALIGAGASNIYTARILIKYGAKPGNLILVDSKGILHPERDDIDKMMLENPWKYKYAIETNAERRKGGIPEAMKGADVVIGASRPGPGVIKKEWVASMNKDAIVFALANPVPEIWPWEAKEAGAKIVATGRSDFPNQINNSLIFPAVFRGALDVRATTITDEMLIAAAEEVAKFAEEKGIHEEYIVPKITEWEVYVREAAAVAAMASSQRVARIPRSYNEELEIARSIISKSIKTLEILMREKIIE
ncbi:MAG: NADP-dependent malic enzyme [Pyrobaculum arsenaticum]|uniref:Malate dehydrogenase (Oxaloacetate-decarboxylating) n=1 Tax=Pyrobaculum arsenaticum (strain DSM 13514 / JCM 11321 / PZ6) TaxID=340102 RepID=A4WN12_PYRAR|nr:NADP-dependent malic enzyme [Pyrobaculum arsenaticum]ABP51779.1 Malate dehydrogenase (oxaloacetate-decarboxylating) [Pyrobaculum arsenaticum DSM 13514]MCY0890025.1 NADP-dependent malic enzyme [Pyrobaculum arsenaticum]